VSRRLQIALFAFAAAFPVVGCGLFFNPVTSVPPGQPDQPDDGSGGSQTQSQSVTKQKIGTGTTAYWLYEPADPVPTSAPVVAFLHGYGGTNPKAYGAWIKHLVLRGNIVIFPIYQTSLANADQYTDDAITAIQSALTLLGGGGHVQPELDHFALAGHSLGGVLVANIAALANSRGLPTPKCILSAHPGDANATVPVLQSIKTGDYSSIPSATLFLGIVGNDDSVVGTDEAISIFDALTGVAADNKQVLEFFTDTYGEPDLEANHGAPLASDAEFDSGDSLSGSPSSAVGVESPGPDAFDFFGYWKLLDALMTASFFGVDRDVALGGGPAELGLGTWSDGTPVHPAEIIRP